MLSIDDLTKGELIGFVAAMNNDRENNKRISWDVLYKDNIEHIAKIRELQRKYSK